MAKIVYKEGLEGQNRLECIEGIEIELLNGQKALVYPKYKELPLLDKERITDWKALELTEIHALKIVDGKELTDELLKLDSPAAKFVRQFQFENHEDFDLPTLFATGEILDQKEDIDALAEIIKGTDLLKNNYDYLWSCCRDSPDGAWFADGNSGFFDNHFLYAELLAVPTKIYK